MKYVMRNYASNPNTPTIAEIIDAGWYVCRIKLVSQDQIANMRSWCNEMMGYSYETYNPSNFEKTGKWYHACLINFDHFFFKHEESLSLFLLKYSEMIEHNNKIVR